MSERISFIEDSIMKNALDIFKDYALSFFGIEQKAIAVARTERKELQLTSLQMDYTYLMEDNSYLHFEFQTTYNAADIYRFHLYDAMLAYKENKKVKTCVVYSSDITQADTELDMGNYIYRVNSFFMKHLDGDEHFKRLKRKVENGKPLTGEDMVNLVFIPIMGGKTEKNRRIEDAVKLAECLTEREHRIKCETLLYAFAEKFADSLFKEKIRSVFKMTEIGKMIWGEAEQSGIEKGIGIGRKEGKAEGKAEGKVEGKAEGKTEIARNMLAKGMPEELVAELTGLMPEEISRLKDGLERKQQ